MNVRTPKFNRELTPEESATRMLQSLAIQAQQIQLETAELERQAVQRSQFIATPEDFEILNQIGNAGGKIHAAELLTSEPRRLRVFDLKSLGLLDSFGDGGGLLVGFSLTQHGQAMIQPVVVEDDYAEPIAKSDLAFLLNVDVATIRRRIKSGELRVLPGTLPRAKKVRIHGDDFPSGLKRPHERKHKLSVR